MALRPASCLARSLLAATIKATRLALAAGRSIYELHVPRGALLCSLDLRLWVSPADSFRADEMTTDRRYAEQEEDQAERRDGQRVPFERTEEAKRVRGAWGPASLRADHDHRAGDEVREPARIANLQVNGIGAGCRKGVALAQRRRPSGVPHAILLPVP